MIVEIENNIINRYELIPFTFEEGIYKIDYSIMDKIQEWSDFLSVPKEEYVKMRYSDLAAYISKRKKLRNFEWYLKRLNLESFKMIIDSKKNLRKYKQLVKKYIS